MTVCQNFSGSAGRIAATPTISVTPVGTNPSHVFGDGHPFGIGEEVSAERPAVAFGG